jgi:hypothetical protein
MRHLITLLLTGLLIFTSSVTLSQDMPYLYCGDLPETDCQLLNNALISLPDLHSARLDLMAQMWQGDAPPAEFMRINGVLNGAVSLDMFRSPAGYYEFLRDLDAKLTVIAPRSLEADLDERISVNFMLLDEVFYIDLDGLQSLLNDPTLPAWGCYDLRADLDAEIKDRLARAEGDTVEPFATGFDPNVLVEVLEADFTRQFVQVTRTDTDGTALFETRVDLAGLYGNPTFREAFRERMLKQEGPRSFTVISDAQLDHLQAVVAALFPEPVVIARFGVDLETGFLSSVYSWRPDEWLFTVGGALRGEDMTQSSLLAFTFTLNLSDFNAARIITPPEGAEPFAVNILRDVEPVWGVLPLSSIVRGSSAGC